MPLDKEARVENRLGRSSGESLTKPMWIKMSFSTLVNSWMLMRGLKPPKLQEVNQILTAQMHKLKHITMQSTKFLQRMME